MLTLEQFIELFLIYKYCRENNSPRDYHLELLYNQLDPIFNEYFENDNLSNGSGLRNIANIAQNEFLILNEQNKERLSKLYSKFIKLSLHYPGDNHCGYGLKFEVTKLHFPKTIQEFNKAKFINEVKLIIKYGDKLVGAIPQETNLDRILKVIENYKEQLNVKGDANVERELSFDEVLQGTFSNKGAFDLHTILRRISSLDGLILNKEELLIAEKEVPAQVQKFLKEKLSIDIKKVSIEDLLVINCLQYFYALAEAQAITSKSDAPGILEVLLNAGVEAKNVISITQSNDKEDLFFDDYFLITKKSFNEIVDAQQIIYVEKQRNYSKKNISLTNVISDENVKSNYSVNYDYTTYIKYLIDIYEKKQNTDILPLARTVDVNKKNFSSILEQIVDATFYFGENETITTLYDRIALIHNLIQMEYCTLNTRVNVSKKFRESIDIDLCTEDVLEELNNQTVRKILESNCAELLCHLINTGKKSSFDITDMNLALMLIGKDFFLELESELSLSSVITNEFIQDDNYVRILFDLLHSDFLSLHSITNQQNYEILSDQFNIRQRELYNEFLCYFKFFEFLEMHCNDILEGKLREDDIIHYPQYQRNICEELVKFYPAVCDDPDSVYDINEKKFPFLNDLSKKSISLFEKYSKLRWQIFQKLQNDRISGKVYKESEAPKDDSHLFPDDIDHLTSLTTEYIKKKYDNPHQSASWKPADDKSCIDLFADRYFFNAQKGTTLHDIAKLYGKKEDTVNHDGVEVDINLLKFLDENPGYIGGVGERGNLLKFDDEQDQDLEGEGNQSDDDTEKNSIVPLKITTPLEDQIYFHFQNENDHSSNLNFVSNLDIDEIYKKHILKLFYLPGLSEKQFKEKLRQIFEFDRRALEIMEKSAYFLPHHFYQMPMQAKPKFAQQHNSYTQQQLMQYHQNHWYGKQFAQQRLYNKVLARNLYGRSSHVLKKAAGAEGLTLDAIISRNYSALSSNRSGMHSRNPNPVSHRNFRMNSSNPMGVLGFAVLGGIAASEISRRYSHNPRVAHTAEEMSLFATIPMGVSYMQHPRYYNAAAQRFFILPAKNIAARMHQRFVLPSKRFASSQLVSSQVASKAISSVGFFAMTALAAAAYIKSIPVYTASTMDDYKRLYRYGKVGFNDVLPLYAAQIQNNAQQKQIIHQLYQMRKINRTTRNAYLKTVQNVLMDLPPVEGVDDGNKLLVFKLDWRNYNFDHYFLEKPLPKLYQNPQIFKIQWAIQTREKLLQLKQDYYWELGEQLVNYYALKGKNIEKSKSYINNTRHCLKKEYVQKMLVILRR